MRFADERLQELFTKCLNKWGQYLHDTDFEDLSALETFERELKYCELEDAFISAVESAINRQGQPCEWEKEQNNRIADLELELEQENASSRVYMDKTDAEIAALTKALDEATSRVVTIDKATDAYVRKHGNFTVVHDYERLSPASRALCERLFGGTK